MHHTFWTDSLKGWAWEHFELSFHGTLIDLFFNLEIALFYLKDTRNLCFDSPLKESQSFLFTAR